MKIKKGRDEMWFMLAFQPTSFPNKYEGFFIELFGHRWEFYLYEKR
jgi:hypothetical protein